MTLVEDPEPGIEFETLEKERNVGERLYEVEA